MMDAIFSLFRNFDKMSRGGTAEGGYKTLYGTIFVGIAGDMDKVYNLSYGSEPASTVLLQTSGTKY